eukprot:6296262-Heterocapsa_arctica.AAC.1
MSSKRVTASAASRSSTRSSSSELSTFSIFDDRATSLSSSESAMENVVRDQSRTTVFLVCPNRTRAVA